MENRKVPTKELSQFDLGGVLRNVHSQPGNSLRVTDIDNAVGEFFTRADVTYNSQGSAIDADFYLDKDYTETEIILTSDVAGSLNGKYFEINLPPENPDYYVWYNVGGTGTDPNILDATGIEVPINFNEDAAIVALATKMLVGLKPELETANLFNGKIRIKSLIEGDTKILDSDTGFAFSNITEGVSEFIKNITLPYDNDVRYIWNKYEKTFELAPPVTISVDVTDNATTRFARLYI